MDMRDCPKLYEKLVSGGKMFLSTTLNDYSKIVDSLVYPSIRNAQCSCMLFKLPMLKIVCSFGSLINPTANYTDLAYIASHNADGMLAELT